MGHTPERWGVQEDDEGIFVTVTEGFTGNLDDSRVVCEVVGLERDRAALIAAAPKLRDACAEINEWLGTEDGRQACHTEPPWYAKLRAALAAAEPKEG